MPESGDPSSFLLSTNETAESESESASETESTGSLVVSSMPIFEMEDKEFSLDEEMGDLSLASVVGQDSPEMEELTMLGWIGVGEMEGSADGADGNSDDEESDEDEYEDEDGEGDSNIPPASSEEGENSVMAEDVNSDAGVDDDDDDDNDEGDATILPESPVGGKDMVMVDDVNNGNHILADPFAKQDYSISTYKPLPGVFGEMIHHGERRRALCPRESSPSVVFSDHVHQDTDITGASVTYSQADTVEAYGDDDTPKYHSVDAYWMENIIGLPWVSKDQKMIFNTESKKLTPMPWRRLEKKKLVIELYTFLIKGVWIIQLSARGDWIAQTIPASLWWEVFTDRESEELQEATRRKLHFDIVTRAITVTEEWRLRYGFPKVPENANDVQAAQADKEGRYKLKCTILTEAPAKSVDRWAKYVFQGVLEEEHMELVLNSGLEGVRQRVISKLIHATEFPFSESWTVERCLKVPMSNRHKMDNIIEEQLNGLFQNLYIRDK